MEDWQERLGRPPPEGELSATDPRVLLAESLRYLRNNAGRMGYPRYSPGGAADDEQSGGVVGGGIQRAGERQAEVLESS
jgi:hypothetical protein